MDSTLPPLPVEIWELIFGNCSVRDLKAIRRVCQLWNGIVAECRSLRNRLMVRFSELEIFEGCVPDRLPVVGRAALKWCGIWTVEGWWADFGANLRQLSLNECRIAMPELLQMLRGCPNLREFQLWQVELLAGRVPGVGFQLEALENVDLVGISSFREGSAVLDYFRQIFPRLKSFSMEDPEGFWDESHTAKLIRLLETVKGTLQVLLLPLDNDVLKHLCDVDQLKLKKAVFAVNCTAWDINLWNRFCQRQPSLQDIHLWNGQVTDEVLKAIVSNATNLKQLTTVLSNSLETIPISFLSHLTTVERVTIHADFQSISLSTHFGPCLTSLHLYQVHLTEGIEFLMNSPHLEELALIDCDISKCPLPVEPKPFSSLKHLNLVRLKNSYSRLEYITSCHPALETVAFTAMRSISSDTIVSLLLMSPKLKQVRVEGCPRFVTRSPSVGAEILQHYHNVTGSPEGYRDVRFVIG